MEQDTNTDTTLSTIQCLTRKHGYNLLAEFIRVRMNDTPDYRGIPNAHSMYDFKENDAAGVAMRNVSLSAARETLPVTKRNANSAHAERLLRAMSTFLDEILRFQGEPTAFWFNKLYQSFSDQ
eukprot:gb/GECG01009019.1/.p1 GENE.gb/GECG01009019.1/~~gb/GECG01009019.1/.p1  ORF type:complete len:123 (+),score=15.71 gb/GECG01009019.1/:1-369(+)